MTDFPDDVPDKLLGTQFMEALVKTEADEREACAKLADEYAARLTQSGKADEAMVAITLAAQIRARK